MSAHIFQFRGTEADADHSSAPRHAFFTDTEPLSDDEREQMAGAVSDWPTTRRFARSAHGIDAAWTDEPEYADPFERFTRASFVDQDAQVQALSQKWAQRCIYAIAIGVVVALLGGWL